MNQVNLIKKVAKAYNNLDYTEIEEVSSDQIVYENQDVFHPLKGKQQVSRFLERKFSSVKSSGDPLFAEIGIMKDKGDSMSEHPVTNEGMPCIIVSQGKKENKVALILIEAQEDKLTRIDICTVSPHWSMAAGTNEFPS